MKNNTNTPHIISPLPHSLSAQPIYYTALWWAKEKSELSVKLCICVLYLYFEHV